jgi:hypothetical protein
MAVYLLLLTIVGHSINYANRESTAARDPRHALEQGSSKPEPRSPDKATDQSANKGDFLVFAR